MNQDHLKQAAMLMRAVDHPIRRRIIQMLHDGEDMTTTEIWIELRTLEQSQVSQYIRILREAKILNKRKSGKESYYSINYDRIEAINLALQNFNA